MITKKMKQKQLIKNSAIYLIILAQFYITNGRMKTKILDDGSYYARIYNCKFKNMGLISNKKTIDRIIE